MYLVKINKFSFISGVVESGFFFDFNAENYLAELKEELANDTRYVATDILISDLVLEV